MTRISHPLISGLAFGGRADDHRARMRLLIGLKGGEEPSKMDGFDQKMDGFLANKKWRKSDGK